MKIRPLRNNIFVLPDKVVDKTESGLILSDYSKKRPSSGTIIALGTENGIREEKIIPKIEKLLEEWKVTEQLGYRHKLAIAIYKELLEELEEQDNFHIGDRVVYGDFSGQRLTISYNNQDTEVFLMTDNDILAILEK